MGGRGKSKANAKQQNGEGQSRPGGGRGRPFFPNPTPAASAWGNAAPAPAVSAWGNRGPAPSAAPASVWGNPAPAASAAPASVWGKPAPAPAPAPVPVSVPVSSPAEGRGRGRPQQVEQRHEQPQRKQQQTPRGNGGAAQADRGAAQADRGSMRGRTIITDIIKTKPESVESKRGTSGQQIQLLTNHFRLLKKPTWQLYQYRVDFSPDIEIRGLRNRLIFEQKPNLGGYLFDGTMLFLSKKLPNELTEFMSKDREGNPIQTTVKFVNLVSMQTAASVQILNLTLRRSMEALNLQLVGRNFFDAVARIDIPQHQLQLWPGYVTSIRQHETDIMLCAEVTNKVMRTETLYDILRNFMQNERPNYQAPYTNAVLGSTVLTGYNNKTYRIDDVDFTLSPMSTFPTRDGDITYVEYYKRKYNLTIRDPGQPLLIHRASERDIRAGQSESISLIPELCRATGMSDRMRNDFKLMSAVAIYTRLSPKMRIEKLTAFNKRLQTTPESIKNLEEWNFSLDRDLVRVSGRVLPPEKIYFANNKTTLTNSEADWSREFRNISMYTSQHLKNWILIVPQCKAREARDFVGVLQNASRGMKYEIANPVYLDIPDDRSQGYAIALDQAIHKDPQLVMCVFMSSQADKYSMVKKKCYVDCGLPSQVMLSKTITPKPGRDLNSLMSVGTKVAIQINSKLGGAPWMVDIPLNGLMVMGFDVCHDTKDKTKSYGALVSTMDMKQAQNYFSVVSAHTNGEELCNEFALNVAKALQTYGQQHKVLPARIMIYRDGVGEGQTNYVFEHEIKNIRAKLDQIYRGSEYKLTFIVVSKRTNTRFFKGDLNPSPGTVVDDVVTLPERYDFFLCSQFSNQGTVSPTNYNVLFDTSGLSPDRIQVLTYKMTHLYYNWSGTLGVPAVCQYAHKLAFIVGNFIHQSPSSKLEKQLYFL